MEIQNIITIRGTTCRNAIDRDRLVEELIMSTEAWKNNFLTPYPIVISFYFLIQFSASFALRCKSIALRLFTRISSTRFLFSDTTHRWCKKTLRCTCIAVNLGRSINPEHVQKSSVARAIINLPTTLQIYSPNKSSVSSFPAILPRCFNAKLCPV